VAVGSTVARRGEEEEVRAMLSVGPTANPVSSSRKGNLARLERGSGCSRKLNGRFSHFMHFHINKIKINFDFIKIILIFV
jgi:hypothetical protein